MWKDSLVSVKHEKKMTKKKIGSYFLRHGVQHDDSIYTHTTNSNNWKRMNNTGEPLKLQLTNARSDGRTNCKHTASGSINWMGSGTKMKYTKNNNTI